MTRLLRRAALLFLFGALPCTLLARRHHHAVPASSDDSDDTASAPSASPSPSPSPAQGKHRHTHGSPSPSPTPSPIEDGSASPSPTPKSKHHKSVSPSPAEGTPSSSPTPPRSRKHHTPPPAAGPDSTTPDTGSYDASTTPGTGSHPSAAPDATLDAEQLEEFSRQPEKIRALLKASLQLTEQNLTYTYGSADPANGGMDCSGFIYYVLTQAGLKDVPRDASGQYTWVRKANAFRAVISRRLDGFELNELKPGDLLFWSGTYKTDRDPPVTHTMIYLGHEKDTGNRVMVGSTDGRGYHGLQRWGVSVFDFKAQPAATGTSGHSGAQFIGYGSIPGL